MPNPSRCICAPHTPLTPRSLESQVEIERTERGYTYRLNGGPTRQVSYGQPGFDACEQLAAVVVIVPCSAADARELRHLERELHEDLFEIEDAQRHAEDARLYA